MSFKDRYEVSNWLGGFSTIIAVLARVSLVIGVLMLLPALVGIIYGEVIEVRVFMTLALIVMGSSYIISRLVKSPPTISLSEALIISSSSWLVVSLIGSLPYILIARMSLIDASFESISGFTTTGMTLLAGLEGLPKSLLFWRSLTQWVGGLGIIMMFIVFAGTVSGVGLLRLYMAEARELKIRASTWITVRDMWLIYLSYTVIATITLYLLGMDFFDAVTHAFTSLATGGFSTKDTSIAWFNNASIETALTVFEFIGATNFLAHYALLTRGFKEFIKYYEVRYYIVLIAFTSFLVSLDLMINMNLNATEALRYSVFQVVSIATTTGYQIADITLWPPLSKAVLVMLMFIGGQLCSTGGAIKLGRLVIVAKVLKNQLEHLYLPPAVVKPVRINGHVVEEVEIIRVFTFVSLYILLVVVGTLTLTTIGYEPFQALSAVASAQGNVGPSYINVSKLSDAGKIMLVIYMWLGRLELIPSIALFIPQIWKQAKRIPSTPI